MRSWAGASRPELGRVGGPPPCTHLQLLELLQLVAEVAGVLLQVVEVQLHVQAGDGRGLPRWRAGGRGRWGRGHRGPHAAAAGGCRGQAAAAEGRHHPVPAGFSRGTLSFPTLLQSSTAPAWPPKLPSALSPCWHQGEPGSELPPGRMGPPPPGSGMGWGCSGTAPGARDPLQPWDMGGTVGGWLCSSPLPLTR